MPLLMTTDITILGGGIAGISAAYHAKLLGLKNICFEANSYSGGLVANFSIQGFRFDNAVHLSFSDDDYVNTLFKQTPYFTHKPDAYCADNGKWLKHPVQNNLYPLSTQDKIECIESFIDRPRSLPDNYEQWLYYQYGNEIARRYPVPYTLKYWGVEPSQLSLSWIGNRMRTVALTDVLKGALENQTVNHYYAKEMRYPIKGGYFQFVKKIADQVNIVCNRKVTLIDLDNKIITFSNGQKISFSILVNTLPLPVFCSLLTTCPENVISAAENLKWTKIDLVSVGFNKPDMPPYLWFYIYDKECIAARAYSPSIKSPDNVPVGKSSLQFEIYSLNSASPYDPLDLIDNIKERLISMNICKEEDILFMQHKHLPFGNVIFDHGMEEKRKVITDYLKQKGIFTCGRFGKWDYLWSDQSFLSAKEVIATIYQDQIKIIGG